ncbi:hypothetical protein NQT67_06405 [Klebsiella pneumoniae]|uniref:hypothetical protein n=1 Tax=Klebsiella pneumoniae TaxID=573 RepID=UPI00255D3B59|nr:hypothetical protein [Klebsiella pneumoniae]MDL4104249.1 hypothetical protein [Klebsiella pneumoniae]
MKKKEEPITTFIWCGAVVQVYTQTITFAGTTIQRHLLPTNLRKAVDQQVAGAANHQEASPRRIQHYQRREGNAEQQHYGVSARAVQGRARSSG